MFAKRLCGPDLSHLSYTNKLKQFDSEILKRRRVKLDFVLLYELICNLFCDADTSSFILFPCNIFKTQEMAFKSASNSPL